MQTLDGKFSVNRNRNPSSENLVESKKREDVFQNTPGRSLAKFKFENFGKVCTPRIGELKKVICSSSSFVSFAPVPDYNAANCRWARR